MEKILEDISPNGHPLFINKGIRCHKCGGCLVTEVIDHTPYENLTFEDENWVCIDSDECEANIEAYNTTVTVTEEGQIVGYKIVKDGEEQLSLEMKE